MSCAVSVIMSCEISVCLAPPPNGKLLSHSGWSKLVVLCVRSPCGAGLCSSRKVFAAGVTPGKIENEVLRSPDAQGGREPVSDLPYRLEFTDGSIPRRITIVAADIEDACKRTRTLVRDILAHGVFGPIDPKGWRAIVISDNEGRREIPFLTE